MKKKYNLKIIKDKRSYTFNELAECLKAHIRTVQSWHKSGISIIEGSHPFLVLGKDAKQFIKTQQEKNTVKLKSDEIYCVACKKAVIPIDTQTIHNKRQIGKNKISITKKGTCPYCKRSVYRLGYEDIKPKSKLKIKEAKPANKELQKTDNYLFTDLPLFSQLI